MNKEREIAGIKVFVSNETYNEYKGTLQDQINKLQDRINKAIEYINDNSLYEEIYDYNTDDEQELQYVSDETATNDLLNILKGDNK